MADTLSRSGCICGEKIELLDRDPSSELEMNLHEGEGSNSVVKGDTYDMVRLKMGLIYPLINGSSYRMLVEKG